MIGANPRGRVGKGIVMRRAAVAVVLLAIGLAGCSSPVAGIALPGPTSAPAPTTTAETSAEPTPTPTAPPSQPPSAPAPPPQAQPPQAPPPPPPPPPPASNLAACFEANCQLTVTGSVTVPLDRKLGFTRFTVTVTAGTVNVDAAFPDGGGGASLSGAGSVAAINQIAIRLVSASGDTAVIALSTR